LKRRGFGRAASAKNDFGFSRRGSVRDQPLLSLQIRLKCKVLFACHGYSYNGPASFQYSVNRPQPDWLSEFGILFAAQTDENRAKLNLAARKGTGR
jgi:hypothetical protein